MDIQKLDLLSSLEASIQLNVSKNRFWHLVKTYKIPHKKVGTCHVFLQEDITDAIERRKENVKKYRKN